MAIDYRIQTRRLEAIIEGTRAGTWEWNVQTNEVIINARWAEIIGYDLEELENRDTFPYGESSVTQKIWKYQTSASKTTSQTKPHTMNALSGFDIKKATGSGFMTEEKSLREQKTVCRNGLPVLIST